MTKRDRVQDILSEHIAQRGFTAFYPIEDPSDLLAELTAEGEFILRDAAENNIEEKQIIPYCLVVYSGVDGDLILHYSRSKANSPEARLAGKRSIGVGGHINPDDIIAVSHDGICKDSYMAALLRELHEEIGIGQESIQDLLTIGFVNDEENEVGQVHIGVVHVVVMNTIVLGQIEDKLNDPQWDTPQQAFLEENLETWSEMILKELRENIEANPWYLSRTA